MAEIRHLPKARAAKCPACGAPAVESYRPFCSKRCKQLDLGKWLNEGYRFETEEIPGSFDEEY